MFICVKTFVHLAKCITNAILKLKHFGVICKDTCVISTEYSSDGK